MFFFVDGMFLCTKLLFVNVDSLESAVDDLSFISFLKSVTTVGTNFRLTGCFSMRPGDEITKKVKQNFGLILLSNG